MKKTILFISVLPVCFSVSSCTDFLTVDSPSKYNEQQIYATENGTLKAVKGIYATLAHSSVYGMQVSTYFGYNTDIEYGHGNAAPDDDRRGLWDYTATPANSEISSFNMMYTAINRANECIAGIEQNSGWFAESDPQTPNMIRNMYGEAKALRALMYLELVRNWGDVPFKVSPTQHDDDFFIGPTDRDVILKYLIEDLISVEPAMLYADQLPESVERMNRGAVQGLISRLCMTYAGWSLRPNLNNPVDYGTMERPDDYMDYYQIARDYAKKLIDSGKHDLGSDFREVFLNQCQEVYPTNGDMLYEVAFALNYSGAIGHVIGMKIASNPSSMYGYSNVYYYAAPTYMASFDPADTRRDATFVPYEWVWNATLSRLEQKMLYIATVPISKWSKFDMKTPQGVSATYNTGINWPVIRFADVLLMFAEAENELNNGPTADAKDVLKRVRRRAIKEAQHEVLVDTYVNALTDYNSFFEAVTWERAWEFGGESIRKYDLIRWNLLGPKLRNIKAELYKLGEQCQSRTGTYANAPAYLYWKMNPDGTLDVQGMDSNLASAPSGYTSTSWFRGLVGGTNLILIDNYDRYYREYILQKDPFVYLYPFHKDVIAESKGALKNYYGK